MWIWMPYLCLGLGIAVGLNKLPGKLLSALDSLMNLALIVLMLTVGMGLGARKEILSGLGSIGLNCLIVSLCAITCSIICTLVVEKTILPLDEISKKTFSQNSVSGGEKEAPGDSGSVSPLIWIMPLCIAIGVAAGYFVNIRNIDTLQDYLLSGALMLLYICAGITMGANRSVFTYLKTLGFKVLFISGAVLTGSIVGGTISGLFLKLPLHLSVISAGGMSFYSLTGAFMTQMYGVETGTYGFIVNMMREFFTILFLPLLVRISRSSPIAVGACAAMDTVLVPITRVVGPELGLVSLITGSILTFVVPLLLPILHGLLG